MLEKVYFEGLKKKISSIYPGLCSVIKTNKNNPYFNLTFIRLLVPIFTWV